MNTPINVPIVYTLRTCPTCEDLRVAWKEQGIEFEERIVDDNQEYMDEAREFGSAVPVIVYPDGRVEEGFNGETG